MESSQAVLRSQRIHFETPRVGLPQAGPQPDGAPPPQQEDQFKKARVQDLGFRVWLDLFANLI